MAQVVRHRPFTTDDRVRSRASSCEICGGQNGTWTGPSNTSAVSRQYHSNSAPILRLSPSVPFQQCPNTSAVFRQYHSNSAPILRLSPVSTIPTVRQYFGCLPSVPFQQCPNTSAVSRQYHSNSAPHTQLTGRTHQQSREPCRQQCPFGNQAALATTVLSFSVGFEAFYNIRHINSNWSSQEYLQRDQSRGRGCEERRYMGGRTKNLRR
jgi:hypothetical protein